MARLPRRHALRRRLLRLLRRRYAPRVIDLKGLADGIMPNLTAHRGGELAEAASVMLAEQGHNTQATVVLVIDGDAANTLALLCYPVDVQMRRSYADLQEATEDGACGVAIASLRALLSLPAVVRSKKGTGFDWWLGDDDGSGLFQDKARLEVSGIGSGSMRDIEDRCRDKQRQVQRGPVSTWPAFIAVVEFGRPMMRVRLL